jgi:hypothetical protein
MRLEEHDHASRRARSHGVDGRADLRRVVGVVVDDRDAARRAELLESSLRSAERREGLGRGDRGDAEGVGRGERPGGVPSVVRAGEAQRDRNRRLERAGEVEGHAIRTLHELDHAIPRLRGHPVGRDLASGEVVASCELGRARVVRARDKPATADDPSGETRERLLHVGVGRKNVDVVVLDVRHDRDLGPEGEERAVVLIRLDDEDVAAPGVRVRAEVAEHRAADERRVEAPGAKGRPRKRGGGALAMGPGHREDALAACELAPRVLPLPDGYARGARGGDLGIGVPVRARSDHDVGAGHVARLKCGRDDRPVRGEGLG